MTDDLTTLICLFHHRDQAQAALEDILEAGIPESNVTLMGGAGSNIEASRGSLAELNVPEQDIQHLLDGLSGGGSVLTVSAISDHADKVESIFHAHKAEKIDENVVDDDRSGSALPEGYTASDRSPRRSGEEAAYPQANAAEAAPLIGLTAARETVPYDARLEQEPVDARDRTTLESMPAPRSGYEEERAREEREIEQRSAPFGEVRVYRRVVDIPVCDDVPDASYTVPDSGIRDSGVRENSFRDNTGHDKGGREIPAHDLDVQQNEPE